MGFAIRKKTRPWIRTAIAALCAAGTLWTPPVDADESQGAARRLRPRVDDPPWVGTGPQPPDGWSQEATVLEPWCSTDAESWAAACEEEEERHVCGSRVTLPCDDPPRGRGIRVLATGAGARNSGKAVLSLRGAPAVAIPSAAWVSWGVITRFPQTTRSRAIYFNGVDLTGEVVGTSDQPCWDDGVEKGFSDGEEEALFPAVFMLFVAEVTPYLDGQVNGDYPVAIHGRTLATGEDPWGGPPGKPAPFGAGDLIEGMTLKVIYSDPNVDPRSLVTIHAGPVSLRGELELIHPIGSLPPGSDFDSWRIGADGQVLVRNEPVGGYRTWLSFDPSSWTLIQGWGSPIDVTPDWQGRDGGPVNRLWDTQLTRIPGWLVTPPLDDWSEYRLRYEESELAPPLPQASSAPALKAAVEPLLDCAVVGFHALWAGSMLWEE